MVKSNLMLGMLLLGLMLVISGCGVGTTTNDAPVITGIVADFNVTVNASYDLWAVVSDDGNPVPPGELTYEWGVSSGNAGDVLFGDASAANTTVVFLEPGDYSLMFTVSDSEKESTKSVDVHVSAAVNTEGGEPVKLEIVGAVDDGEVHEDANPIINAFDGDLNTRWSSRPLPVNVIFDLGAVKYVGQTDFLFYNYNQSRVYQYSVSVSVDGNSWDEVVSQRDSKQGWTSDNFTPVSARYVRLSSLSQNTQSDWAGLWEAEIWSGAHTIVQDCNLLGCPEGDECDTVSGECEKITPPAPTCDDNIKNQGEEGVDCGGPCAACENPDNSADLYGTKTKYSCDYYASPNGNGNGLSEGSPFKIADFWGVNNIAGKTLCLLNGTYTGTNSMITPPEGLSGTEGSPIRVVALYDGKVFIDGEGDRGPILLNNNNWFVVEGINIFNANQVFQGGTGTSTSYVKNSHDIIYRRVVAWDSGPGNTDNFATDYSKRVTYEDIGSFGQSRKMAGGGHRSDEQYDESISGNRVRRAWARLEKNDYGGEGVMSVGYNTNGNIIENSIATVDGELKNLKGEGSSDSFGFLEDRQWDQNNQILGSIAYKTKDQKIIGQEQNSYLYADSQNMTTKDMLIFVEGDQSTFGTNLEATARLNPYHWDNFTGKDLTFIGGPGVLVAPNTHSKISNIIVTNATWNPDADVSGGRRVPATGLWSALTGYDPTDYVMAWGNHINWNVEPTHNSIEDPNLIGRFGNLLQYGTASRPTVNGEPVGAQIACRYENGVLTKKPLWPWPMEERIRVATCMYDNNKTLEYCEKNKELGEHVTKTVFELGGGHLPDFNTLNPIVCPDGDYTNSSPAANCSDGIQNQGEEGVDCGGPCPACGNSAPSVSIDSPADKESFDVGATVDFSGSVSDSDSSLLNVYWYVDLIGDGFNGVLVKESSQAPGPTSASIVMSGSKINADGKTVFLDKEGATYNAVLVADDGVNEPVEKRQEFTLSNNDVRLSVNPEDSHYFISSKGEPIFFIGHHDALGWWKGKKWPNVRDALKSTIVDNHLSFAKIQLPIQGPAEDVDMWAYKRTGPGNANDGGPKFDLMSLNPAFWDELENLLAWGDTNDVYIQISLFSGIAFKSRSDNYAWPGAVFNPDNRINTEASNVGYRGQNPDMYDVFDSSAGWVSENDRKWMRNRLKDLVDETLKRGTSYKNWWVEIGIENDAPKDWKEYWIHYIHGDTNPIDDHAVSPYAIPDLLIEDNSDYGADMSDTDLVQAQEVHNVVSSNVASKVDGMYSDPILALANTDGSETTDVSSNRRMAWISLTHGGHFNSYDEVNPESPPSFLSAFKILMNFIEKDRGGYTIEQFLPLMHPDKSIISGGHAMRNDAGEPEKYIIFAQAGTNPTIQVSSANLSITRMDTTTGTESVVGVTKVGSNTLVGTGKDTVWWIYHN